MTVRRRRSKQAVSLETRLETEAIRLREQAQSLPSGAQREQVLPQARKADAGSPMSEWLRSPGSAAKTGLEPETGPDGLEEMSDRDIASFRTQAEDCRRNAEKAVSPIVKVQWLRVAREWIKLAHDAEARRGGK